MIELDGLEHLHQERGIDLRVVDDQWALWSEVICLVARLQRDQAAESSNVKWK